MRCTAVRTRLVALVAALPLALVLQPQARGQEPALEVFYRKLEPKEQFKYKWKDKEGVCSAGVFRWEVPESEFSTNGLDRNFTGYCAEVLVPITADNTYRFRTNNIYAAENYNLAGLPKDKADRAAEAANRRTRYVQELFGRHFRDPVLKPVNSTDAVAFQIALWEIIQESEPAEGDAKLDLFAGDFQANYPKAEAPVYVTRAQEYLDSLTGKDDALLIENPDLRGRELIRLKGLESPGAGGVVAQSQFALRFKGGGGAPGGGAFARALTAGGGGLGAGVPVGGSGAGGGLGGGSGGGGLFAGNPNGSSGNGSTFPATTTTTTPVGGGSTTPPTTTTSTPPVGGSDKPKTNDPGGNDPGSSNPVPAPAGLILGGIALGTLGTWRFGARLLATK